MLTAGSPESVARTKSKDLVPVEEELRVGKGCAISGLANSLAYPESHGSGGGELAGA
jgi:hypothetical protein